MKQTRTSWICLITAGLAGVLLLFSACEISGGNETVRNVSIRIGGSYVNSSGIPSNQSGNRITQLAITQSGDRLDAVDNFGGRWNGSIGQAESNLATFTLKGMTSAGAEVVLTGTITVDGTNATLSGTWIEPSLRAAASAQASVAPAPLPTPVPTPGNGNGSTPTPTPQTAEPPTLTLNP
jgi:hypothetical protein